MTATQSIAIFLYSCAAVFAIFGPGIAAFRILGKYRESKKIRGTAAELNTSMDPVKVRAAALRDATWGIVEFGFVAAGVVLASIASIILVVPAS